MPLQPLPDFWTLALFKRLVGPTVLNATVAASGADGELLRVYAHCSKGQEQAALLLSVPR